MKSTWEQFDQWQQDADAVPTPEEQEAEAWEYWHQRACKLEAALHEVHRRTGLLLHQNTGRWNMTIEHDVRTVNVLQSNQEIASKALKTAEGTT